MSDNNTQIIVAVISLVGVIGASLIGYLATRATDNPGEGTTVSVQTIECPSGFLPTDSNDGTCVGKGSGCDSKFKLEIVRTCGVTESWQGGTASGMILPYPFKVIRPTYSELPTSFTSKVPDNIIICEAHGSTPSCGDTGKYGQSNVVGWNVVIKPTS